MKKVLAVFAAMIFLTGIGFAEGNGDVIVKFGLDFPGDINVKYDDGAPDMSEGMEFGFNVSGEYLYPVLDIVKIGAGLEYLFGREMKIKHPDTLSYLPIYATVKVNPISSVSEVFLKGNIGYNVLFDIKDLSSDADAKGGLYWALGAGYEFSFGLVLEAMYSFYYSKVETTQMSSDIAYSKLGINIGYKLAL